MKRNRYGLNFQTLQLARFSELAPLGYVEVVPGDTISGTVQSRLFSDTTKKPLLNRAYWDVHAMYVPFRLLFPDFPDFVVGKADSTDIELPRVDDIWYENFESGFTIDNAGTPQNVAWLRRAYNLCFNQFFRPSENPERTLDQGGTFGILSMRRSTFLESALDTAQSRDTPLDTTNVETARQSFARDRFEKTRQFYGSKYTDYLAALGVEASWSILDEPELIAKHHTDCKFRMISATAQSDATGSSAIGQPAGYYDSVATLNLKKTFCPEHGVICFFGAPRMDSINNVQGPHFLCQKYLPGQYWSPEYAMQSDQGITAEIFSQNTGVPAPTQQFAGYTPAFDDLRKGNNHVAALTGVDITGAYFATYGDTSGTPAGYQTRTPASFAPLFQGILDPNGVAQYQATSAFKLVRNSPLAQSPGRGVA